MRAYAEATWGCWLPAADPDGFVSSFDPHHQFVVELDGEAIGVIAVEEHDEAVALEKLYLSAGHRNRGIGSQLLKEVLSNARKKGKPVRLRTLAVNVRAQAFYLRHGFSVERRDQERVFFVGEAFEA